MEKEQIPNDTKLYLRVSKAHVKTDDDINLQAFKPHGDDGLSVNWNKYSTTELCLTITGKSSKTHGIAHFVVGNVREIENLTVVHDPIEGNYPHSLICGIPPEKPKEPYNAMRKKLKRIFTYWDIAPETTQETEVS
jgi:hypothetical protein